MRLPRVSLGRLMTVIALVGVNLGAVRLLHDHDHDAFALLVLVPFGIALEVETYLLIRGRRRLSPFWVGFLATGILVLSSLVWAQLFPRVQGVAARVDPVTGTRVFTTHVSEGSSMATVWYTYQSLVNDAIEYWPSAMAWLERQGSESVFLVLAFVVLLLPNLVLPATGGLLAWGWLRLRSRRRSVAESA